MELPYSDKLDMIDVKLNLQDFQRPSPYQSPESISPFRSTFVSQRSSDSPTINGYNSSRTSYQEYPTTRYQIEEHFAQEPDVEVAQETNSQGL